MHANDEREQAIIDGIKRGQADVAAGRMVPDQEAMAELSAAIEVEQFKFSTLTPKIP